MSKIKVKQVRSAIGHSQTVRKTMVGLGLRGMNQVKEHKDNNCIRGMINKVKHLVSYELIK
jgi:large subunit ribosomal protein L30